MKNVTRIEKGLILVLKKDEFNDFANASRFSDDLKSIIIAIVDKWFKKKAVAVLFLLNYINYDYLCDSFLPIFKSKEDLLTYAPLPQDEGDIICLRPKLSITFLQKRNQDIYDVLYHIFRHKSNWTKEFGFGIGDNNMPIKKINLNPYIDNPNSYISKEVLSSLENEFSIYKKLSENNSTFKPLLHEIVLDIEQVRKELDVKEGFTEIQKEAHDITIHVPNIGTTKNSFFDGNIFERLSIVVDKLIQEVCPFLKNEYTLAIPAVSGGSTTLFVDIVPIEKERKKEIQEKIQKDTKEAGLRIKTILKEANVLIQKSSKTDDEKIDVFLERTKLEPEKAAVIIDKLDNLFPKNDVLYNNIDLYVQSEEPAVISFSKENIQSFGNVKRTITEQTKEEFESEISGLLGAVEVWNKAEPKFKIKTDTGKRKTICYEATAENEKKVKLMIGKNVKIKISQDGKSNILEKWL